MFHKLNAFQKPRLQNIGHFISASTLETLRDLEIQYCGIVYKTWFDIKNRYSKTQQTILILECVSKSRLVKGHVGYCKTLTALHWRHNERDGVSNHQPHDCLLNCLFRLWSKKPSKSRVTGLWAGNSPMTGEFPAQRASNAENVSIWGRHHMVQVTELWLSCYLVLLSLDDCRYL